MSFQPLTIIDILRITAHSPQPAQSVQPYTNIPLAMINDHVIRVSVMTEPYFWHLHPNSDETFLVIEGSVLIDLEGETIELLPNQLFTIPKNVKHRTRPKGARSVNLTVEAQDMETVRIEE